MAATKHTIVAVVEDKPGVLNRMVSVFRRRGSLILKVLTSLRLWMPKVVSCLG